MDQDACSLIGIIDDSEAFRNALGGFLRSVGYRTTLFESADAFLKSDRNHHADCLIVDYQMPGMHGLQLVRTLTDGGYSAPIIMVSFSADDICEAALNAGAVAVFPKPVQLEVLLDAIRTTLKREGGRGDRDD